MNELDSKKDILESFIHTFIGDEHLNKKFMSMIDDYARSYHLKESKLFIERMKSVDIFKEEYQINIDDKTNSLTIRTKN